MLRIAIAALLTSTAVANAQTDCRPIKDNQARLECFDKQAVSSSPRPNTKRPETTGSPMTVGKWELLRQKDSMTDEANCTIFFVGKPYIQVSARDLYIGYSGRGGIQGFRYRIDDQPATQMQVSTEVEQRIGSVHIGGSAFQEILHAHRLRISTLTLIAGLKEEDTPLQGLARLHERLMRECQEPSEPLMLSH